MDFKEFRRRIEIIQKAMVERGISEDNDYDAWCDYREPAISKVFQKTIGTSNSACSWRTDRSLWIRETNEYLDWTFRSYDELTDEEINHYIATYHPFDKAGAYGIQEWIGYIGVTGLQGSYFNVMGLPVQRIYAELAKM